MKVGQLMVRLAKADPEDIVVIDTDLQCLLLLNQRPGMFQHVSFDEPCAGPQTQRDKEFLRLLRVRF